MKISKIKPNPNNPRIIKDDKFDRLLKSIQDFPEMMEKRPMVCVTDADGKIYPLGGNMRYKALIELGYKEIPDSWIMLADDWTQEKRNEFVIKDNLSFGEWAWDDLANKWDDEKLNEWGLNVPNWSAGIDANSMSENDLDLTEEFDPVGKSSGLQHVVFIFDSPDEAESYLKIKEIKYQRRNGAWQVNLSSLYT